MKLTVNEISFLSNLFDVKSPISLFSSINNPCGDNEKKSLEKKGILKDGKLTSESSVVLSAVANAQKCSRMVLSDGICVLEKYTYKTDDKLVLVENDNGEMVFSIVDDLTKALYEISTFTGASPLKTCEISNTFTQSELLVLFATIDLYRKNAMFSYIGQDAQVIKPTFEQIEAHINTPSKNSIVLMLKNNYNFGTPTSQEIKTATDSLIKKQCIADNSEFALTFEYDIFSKSFLMPEVTILFETLNTLEENFVVLSALCVCSGIKDIVTFIFNEEDTEVTTLSGNEMLQIAEKFLICPDLV